MRQRLRPAYSEAELAQVYQTPHQHWQWKDHQLRVQMTIAFASWFKDVNSIADLSAGDAAIINAIPAKDKYIGDFAPGYELTGSIDETIDLIPKVDLFICSETIEHLDDPEATLTKIRAKTKAIIITTPDSEVNDSNPQHYWGWDSLGVMGLLEATGFKPVIFNTLQFKDPNLVYDYQFWGCV
jgi:hypothetical protein